MRLNLNEPAKAQCQILDKNDLIFPDCTLVLRVEGSSVKGSPHLVRPLVLILKDGPTHNSKITELYGPAYREKGTRTKQGGGPL